MTSTVHRRRSLAVMCGVTVACVIGATAGWVGLQAGVSRGAPTLTDVDAANATPLAVRTPSISADGKFVAFTSVPTNAPAPLPFVRDVVGVSTRPVPVPAGVVSTGDTAISADGCKVAYWGSTDPNGANTKALYLWDRCTAGAQPLSIVPASAGLALTAASSVVRPALSANGAIVAYAAQPDAQSPWHVAAVDVAAGGERAAPDTAVVTTVAVSVDGLTVAYDAGTDATLAPSAVMVARNTDVALNPTPLAAVANASVMAMPSLTADGATVAFVAGVVGAMRLYVTSTLGGAPVAVDTGPAGQVTQPTITPDGSQVGIVLAAALGRGLAPADGSAGKVVVARATSPGFASSAVEPISDGTVGVAAPALSATGRLTVFGSGSSTSSAVVMAERLPALTVTPSATFDLGTVAVGSASQPAKVTFSNPSTVGLVVGSVTALDAPFSTLADACSNSIIPPGGSCVVTVQFQPTDAVKSSASLTVGGEGLSATATITGTGRALARSLSISPNTLQFPATAIGNRGGPVGATVTNTGEVAVNIADVVIGGSDGGQFVLTANACSGTLLGVDDSCAVEVTAIPSRSGSLSGSLTVTGLQGESASATLAVTGVSVTTTSRQITTTSRQTTTTRATTTTIAPPGRLQADPASVVFAATPVGSTSTPAPVTITNTGGSTVSSLTVQVAGDGQFAVAADDCSGRSLAVGSSCALSVTVTPAVGGGSVATLTVQGGRGESTAVSLSATAAFAPTLRLNPGVVTAGGTTIITGAGFSPSSTVQVELVAPNGSGTPVPLGTAVTDATGGLQMFTQIPSTLGQGGWRVQVPAGTDSAAAQVSVLIQPRPSVPGVVGGGLVPYAEH